MAAGALEQPMTLPERVPTPNPDVVATELSDGQLVLLNINTGEYISLNRTAALIWDGIEAGRSPATICSKLMDQFDVTEDHATDSVSRFLQDLAEAGLTQSQR